MKRRFRFTRTAAVVVMLVVVASVVGVYFGLVQPTADRASCHARIWHVAWMLDQYQQNYGAYPPSVTYDRTGKAMHSWRVIVLKELQPELCSDYDLGQPWDSPDNQRLADKAPHFFQCPQTTGPGVANYLLIVGDGALFSSPGHSRSLKDVTDPPGSTILLVECHNLNINWLEPRDLDLATMSLEINDDNGPGISSRHRSGAAIVFADLRTIRLRRNDLTSATLRGLITANGGELPDPAAQFPTEGQR